MGRGPTAVVALLALAATSCSHAPTRPAQPQAASAASSADAFVAAEEWLALVDEGQYGKSWDDASSLFRERIAREQWIAVVRGIRGGLGRIVSRSFKSSDYAQSESRTAILLVWKSDFESYPDAIEQVTMILDGSAWRCAGYFVRKR